MYDGSSDSTYVKKLHFPSLASCGPRKTGIESMDPDIAHSTKIDHVHSIVYSYQLYCLVVEPPLRKNLNKYESQWEGLSHIYIYIYMCMYIYGKIKHVPNHQQAIVISHQVTAFV